MSKKLVFLAASSTALLWACSAGTDETEADTPTPPPAETVSAPEDMDAEPPAAPAAETPPSEPVRSAEAHVHGAATLAIAVEGSTVTVELDSPLYNLIGFEHAAESDEQLAVVKAAEATLSDPASLFVFNADAGCTAQAEGLDVHLEGTHDAHDHDHHDHDEEAHDADDHDEHDHEDDAHAHETHDDDDESSHKDALITYTFECAAPDKLSPISVDLLGKFPNMEDLDVVYLEAGKQDLFSLSQSNTEIKLRP